MVKSSYSCDFNHLWKRNERSVWWQFHFYISSGNLPGVIR